MIPSTTSMVVTIERKMSTPQILIPYLAFILLVEADYIFEVMNAGFISWNF